MKHRQFGPWSARIIGPQVHLTGPRGLTIIAGAAKLRSMSTDDSNLHGAMCWALGELDRATWAARESVDVVSGRIFFTDATGLTRVLTAETARVLAEHDSTSAADAVALRDAAEQVEVNA